MTGLPVSTTHRITADLAAWQLLQRAPDGRYGVGCMLYLIFGIAELAQGVQASLREKGSTAVGVDDIAKVPAACDEAGPNAFDGYIQLPATFTITGSDAVSRMHHYFADGVLVRYHAVAAPLPTLRSDSRLTFVMGVLPDEVSTDDVEARSCARCACWATPLAPSGRLGGARGLPW